MVKPASMTDEQLKERARNAAAARWGKRFDWETSPLDECLAQLASMRSESERGSEIVQRRMADGQAQIVKCFNFDRCGVEIDISKGRYAGAITRVNPANSIPETVYACSAACYLHMNRDCRAAVNAGRSIIAAPAAPAEGEVPQPPPSPPTALLEAEGVKNQL